MKYPYYSCFSFVLLLLTMLCCISQKAPARSHHSSISPFLTPCFTWADTVRKFKSFNYPDTSGKRFSLEDLKKNKRTLVVFWASWCAPCRKEIPAFKELYNKYKSMGFSMISISVDQQIKSWKRAVQEEHMPWPNIANLPNNHHPLMEHFGINAVPFLLLLDSEASILLTEPSLEQLEDNLKSNL
jgi:thiol-disulfide isomerase/thioredoxin